jgi:hypothetical protein
MIAEPATWVERSRRAQGLGLVIDDPAILARVATLAFAGAGPEGRDPPTSNRPPEGGRRARNPAKEPSIENPTRTAQTGQGRTRVRRGGDGRARR